MAIRDQLMSALSQYGQSLQLPMMSQEQSQMFDLYANRPDFAQNYYPAVESQQRVALANRQENRLQGQQDALQQLAQRLGGGFTTRDALAQLAVAQGDPTALINFQIQEEEKARQLQKQNQIRSVMGGVVPTGINPAAQQQLNRDFQSFDVNPYAGAGNPAINQDYSQIEPLISLDQPIQEGRTAPPVPPTQMGAFPQIPQTAPQPMQEPQALKQLGLMAQLDPATYGDDYLKAKLAYEQEQIKAPMEADKRKAETDKTLTEGERDLRKEFEGLPDVKQFRDVESAYKRIQKANTESTGASDIALIFNYMKMLDPSSTVREGEFATAQTSGGVPALIRSTYNQAVDGQRLTPEQRANFLSQATAQYQGAEQLFTERATQYSGLASQYGYNPERIVQGARGKPEIKKPPIDPAILQYMTPEERALFQ